MNRKEPCKCAHTRGAAATPRPNPREPEALWAHHRGPWSTEPKRVTQVWLKTSVPKWLIYSSPPPLFSHSNKSFRPQSTTTRRPWREAVWRNPCQSWTTTNTMCFHIWRRTAGGFPSTTCCTKSHPSMAKQETGSAWVLKQLIVHSWSVLLVKYALQACCWFLSNIFLVIIHSHDIQEAAQTVIFNSRIFLCSIFKF